MRKTSLCTERNQPAVTVTQLKRRRSWRGIHDLKTTMKSEFNGSDVPSGGSHSRLEVPIPTPRGDPLRVPQSSMRTPKYIRGHGDISQKFQNTGWANVTPR